jgi:hypothetical protein
MSQKGSLVAKLDKDGRKESTGVLFSDVFEAEKEVSDVC